MASEAAMKSGGETSAEFYRTELAAEFARNQVLEQQIERLLTELSRLKADLAAMSSGKQRSEPSAPEIENPAASVARPAAVSQSGITREAAAKAASKAAVPEHTASKPEAASSSVAGAAPADRAQQRTTAPSGKGGGKARKLVAKLSRSRLQERQSSDEPPCQLDEQAEALFQGTREFVPTEERAQHSWTLLMQPQPVGTPFRFRFAVRADDLPLLSVRLRYAGNVQQMLRYQIDFKTRTLMRAGGKVDVDVVSATAIPLDGRWLLCEFVVVPHHADALSMVLVILDPESDQPWLSVGKPGQRLQVGAASVAVSSPSTAVPPSVDPTPKVRVIRRKSDAASPQAEPDPADLPMSARDEAMSPEVIGGRPVTPSRWKKLAEQRLGHERAFAASGEYDKILAMKDIYKGKRAFILGNGPSINQQDLTLLRDEITFVANWFINHKRFRRINPKFYCVSSHEMFGGWGKEPDLNADFARLVAEKQTEQTFFFSNRFASYMKETGLVPEPRLRSLIFDRPKFLIDEIGTQNYDLARCMDDGYTVLLTFCVPLCVHFGITDIYLLGCDCDYGLTAPSDPKSYFYRPEQHTSSTTSFDSLVRIWTPGGPIFQTYEIVAREAESRGTRMFNATRGGRLELLPRVEYESLVQG